VPHSSMPRSKAVGHPMMTPFIERGQALATVVREQDPAFSLPPHPGEYRSPGKCSPAHSPADPKKHHGGAAATQEVRVYYNKSPSRLRSNHGRPSPGKNGQSTMLVPGSSLFTSDDFALLLRDAEAGVAGACFQVGECYRQGRGVPRHDPARAVAWYRKGGKRGEANSLQTLAELYQTGELETAGVPMNPSKADKYFRLSLAAAGKVSPRPLPTTTHTTQTVSANGVRQPGGGGAQDMDSSSGAQSASPPSSAISASFRSSEAPPSTSQPIKKPSLRRRLSFGAKGFISAAKNAFRGPKKPPSARSVPSSPVAIDSKHSGKPPRGANSGLRRALSFPKLHRSWSWQSEESTPTDGVEGGRTGRTGEEEEEFHVHRRGPDSSSHSSMEVPGDKGSSCSSNEEAIHRLSQGISHYQQQLNLLKGQVQALGSAGSGGGEAAYSYGRAAHHQPWRYEMRPAPGGRY